MYKGYTHLRSLQIAFVANSSEIFSSEPFLGLGKSGWRLEGVQVYSVILSNCRLYHKLDALKRCRGERTS